MILILSKSKAELSTNDIIDYLQYYDAPFFRLNGDDLVNGKVEIDFFINIVGEWDFVIKDLEINFTFHKRDVNVVWFRRHFNNSNFLYDENPIGNAYLKKEIRTIYSLFEISLRDRFWINTPSNLPNKFFMLQLAMDVGLNVPFTLITNNNRALKGLDNSEDYITKSASDCVGFLDNDHFRSISTHRININEIKEDFFFPSKVQQEVKKEYEVRTFYLEGEYYSMAIFSQGNEKTELDFRNYDLDKPNRMSKYFLPKPIEKKVKALMRKLNMNCGSIDFIKGTDGNYYFLEVNPVGQFGFTSKKCNYNIEKIIAKKLIEANENNNKTNKLPVW